MNKFEIGAAVRWSSQSQGSETEKRGTVHAIVPAGKLATDYLPPVDSRAQIKFDQLVGGAKFDRYIIAVPRGGRSTKVDYYCPRPRLLQVVEVE